MNPRHKVILALATLLVLVGSPAHSQTDPDQQRAGWRYRRDVVLKEASGSGEKLGLANVSAPPDMLARCQSESRDLRVIAPSGEEVPYVVQTLDAVALSKESHGLIFSHRTEDRRSVWDVDLGEVRDFDSIELLTHQHGFVKRIDIEVGDDKRNYRPLVKDVGIFDHFFRWPIHHTVVGLDFVGRGRYLRVIADDRTSLPLVLTDIKVRRLHQLAEERWRKKAGVKLLGTVSRGANGSESRYELDLPPGLPIETLEVTAPAPAYIRTVEVQEVPVDSSPADQRGTTLGVGLIYKVNLPDAGVTGQERLVQVNRPSKGRLHLLVKNHDSPQLQDLEVHVSGVADRLVFPVLGSQLAGYRLYYGNGATRAPHYDLEILRERLRFQRRGFFYGEPGAELENPKYRAVPPLTFVQPLGAEVERSRWQYEQRLSLDASLGEDLYSVILAPESLSLLRDDLGDLRIVDSKSRQVPYVLSQAVQEKAVALEVAMAPVDSGGQDKKASGGLHRYRLSPRGVSQALPMFALDVDFAEPFFSRRVRVLHSAGDAAGGRAAEREIYGGTLLRSPESDAVSGALRILVTEGRYLDLVLEIDDGDNAPLAPTKVSAIVRVPRVAFKLKPEGDSGYSLLLGNAEANAPVYDIEVLRQKVLDYAALPLASLSPAKNAGYRPAARDYLRTAPPTLLLWGVLLLAIVGLLFLTARLLRKGPEA